MRKLYLSLLVLFMILTLVGSVSAGPIIVNGPLTVFTFGSVQQVPPPPIPINENPFTYSSAVTTHINVWDGQCIGDMFSVYDGNTYLGDTSTVINTFGNCQIGLSVEDAEGDARFSNGCFNLAPGAHSINIFLIQSFYGPVGYSWGQGGIRVNDGYCPGTGPVSTPEFPSAFLPATMIIGFLGAVLLIQRTREQ